MTTVMVAVDDREKSHHIFQAALRCFGHDANYLAIHVEDWNLTIGWPWGVAALASAQDTVGGYPATVVTADDAAAEANQISREAGVEATPIGALGNPVTGIVQAAIDHDVDVIVAGWHHHNWLQRLFIQPTPEALLDSTTVPILFVPETSLEAGRTSASDAADAGSDLSNAADTRSRHGLDLAVTLLGTNTS